jgi:hypothetical protein
MHLAAYHFDGDIDALQAGYDRVMTRFSGEVMLNLSVARAGGITVYDVCPTVADFEAFSTSDEFSSALAEAGLPKPRIESLGDIRATHGSAVVQPA